VRRAVVKVAHVLDCLMMRMGRRRIGFQGISSCDTRLQSDEVQVQGFGRFSVWFLKGENELLTENIPSEEFASFKKLP